MTKKIWKDIKMMPTREIIKRLKSRSPERIRVELVAMSDTYVPPRRTWGTMSGVTRLLG